MIVSSTSREPLDMATQEIVQELITATQKNGWDSKFHCVVPQGAGRQFIKKCRFFLSRVKDKAKSTGKPQRQFKLGSDAVVEQVEEIKGVKVTKDVVTFYLYQTRVDKIADEANEMLASLITV